MQGRKETVAQTDSGRSSAHRRLYLPASARHQFQLCPARLGGLSSSLFSWTPPSEHLWLSGVALDSPNIKPFLQEDRCRMPFFLLFLACLMSALVVRSHSCFFFSWKVNVELLLITPGSSVFVICGVASTLVGKKRTRSKCCQARSNRFLSNQQTIMSILVQQPRLTHNIVKESIV